MTPDPIAARARELNVNPSAIPPHALLKWLESRTFSSKDQPYVDGIRDFIRLHAKPVGGLNQADIHAFETFMDRKQHDQ